MKHKVTIKLLYVLVAIVITSIISFNLHQPTNVNAFDTQQNPAPAGVSATACMNFSNLAPGTSVEGLHTMYPGLNIVSSGDAVAIHEGDKTAGAYGAPSPIANMGPSITNQGVGDFGGFVDITKNHNYQFFFMENRSVKYFALNMLDFGDYNPMHATNHEVTLVAYNSQDQIVSTDQLSFTSDSAGNPTSGSAGNLQITGDAVSAVYGEPGNYIFEVSGSDIVRLDLLFSNNVQDGAASDPNIGFAGLCFEPEEIPPPNSSQSICMDFNQLEPGESVEGLGTLHPGLNIVSSGDAVAIREGVKPPGAYGAPSPIANMGPSITNQGVGDFGGFVDITKNHNYQFFFAENRSVKYFALNMLDFGDYNPMHATNHEVTLVAYNSQDQIVSTDQLSFTSDSAGNPTSGSAGNLQITGDAVSAVYGEPGNYIFEVSGSDIVRLDLLFSNNVQQGAVSDPNIGFAVLCFEPEETPPPPVPPQSICMDFNQLEPGESVEGLGTLYPGLNIVSSGDAVAIREGVKPPGAYGAPSPIANMGPSITNQGVGDFGGFVDITKNHNYQFFFAENRSVKYFALNMLDFGDYNPMHATNHEVTLVAYNSQDQIVSTDQLSFTSDSAGNPTSGSAGNLQITGDAVSAVYGEPGNYIFEVSGSDIVRLDLLFSNNVQDGAASDPKIGFAVLCFEPEKIPPPIPPPSICMDFNQLEPGESVEGLGTLHPGLNIVSSGDAVAIREGVKPPGAYGAPSPIANMGPSITNQGVGDFGGFVDITKIHDYQFFFAENRSVKYFTLNMLDFGDYNPMHATNHEVTLVAYNSQDQIVSTDQLSFTSDSAGNPTSGSAGNLQITGDAVSAVYGEPGNYIFEVSGSDIVRLDLLFSNNVQDGAASDPKIGFAVLCFEPEEIREHNVCEDYGLETIAATGWDEHVIRDMSPVELEFVRPYGAEFAIVNTGWGWSGHPDQEQVTEMHSVTSSIGSTTSQDYGNEELEGEIVWYDSFFADFDSEQLDVTIDYAGDGSDRGSHWSHGEVLWCAEELPPPPPEEYLTCEDLNMDLTTIAWDDWTYHIMRGDAPIDLTYAVPSEADYVLINTGWEWTGRANQLQLTEKHTVVTPFGSTTSEDYGDEELENTVYWYDFLHGSFTDSELDITLSYAGSGADVGSHRSHGMIKWCRSNP